MKPPKGFATELYPLRHRILYSFGLSAATATQNSAYATLVMSSTDMASADPSTIVVNPHNANYVTDSGPLVRQMSIIDKLRLSIRFNMTAGCADRQEVSTDQFDGDSIYHLYFTWRPIFFSFPEKLDAADDDTGTTVATILGLTKDATNEDVVPLTTSKLPVVGNSDLSQPISTVNDVQVFGDYNMSTNLTMEDHPWDETLFQEALKRYTNKGALKACVGRTRHVHLTRNKPYKTYFLDKFVPRAIRRVVPYSHLGIQINVPTEVDIKSDYSYRVMKINVAHLGVKMICHYHEWNAEHDQDMTA